MRQLSATDAFFLQLEKPHVPFHIGILQIYQPLDGRAAPSLEEVLANLRDRLHLSESFRQKLVTARFGLDFPYWIEDPDFDLEYHVRHVALPRPGTFAQLSTLAARLHSRILDRTRPLWEITVIEGLDSIDDIPAGSFAVYFKIHHAAIDGVAGAELLSAIHSADPTAAASPAPVVWTPTNPPSGHGLLLRAAGNNLRRPMKAIRSAVPVLPSPRSIARFVIRLPRRSSEIVQEQTAIVSTRFNGPVTAHRTFDVRVCALEDLKQIKNSIPGATVNDVALAVVGGALRYYLEARGEAPDSELVALVPVSRECPPTRRAAIGSRSCWLRSARTSPIRASESPASPRRPGRRRSEQRGAGSSAGRGGRSRAGAVVGVAMRRLGPLARHPASHRERHGHERAGPTRTAVRVRSAHAPPLRTRADRATASDVAHLVGSYAGIFSFSVTACREMLPGRSSSTVIRSSVRWTTLRKATGVTASPIPVLASPALGPR